MRSTMILFLNIFCMAGLANGEEKAVKNPKVLMETSMGNILLELFQDESPVTVDNFLGYASSGHYDGTIFHRVIPKFMNQGGGFTPDMKQKPTQKPIKNEADNGLKNERGTIAMARTQDPHSATNQFFINTADNHFLNHKSKDMQGWGYAVFGRVIEGMDVVDSISKVKTTTHGMYQDVPSTPIVIKKVTVQR